jgi:hypothetical protein
MAKKRMFSKEIVWSDAFLDMPDTSQLLYFHLGMESDDDGFVGNPKKVSRFIGASDDDLKILITKKFVLVFESGILVLKHHRMNNNWDKHNCKRTVYIEEYERLRIKENKAYTMDKTKGVCLQTGNRLKTVVRIEENRIEENRKEKKREEGIQGEVAVAPLTPQEKTKKFFKGITDIMQKIQSIESDSMKYLLKQISTDQGIELPEKKKVFWAEIKAFGDYWQEKDHLGKREKWQMQKTFEVERRLQTWLKKAGQWNKQANGRKFEDYQQVDNFAVKK